MLSAKQVPPGEVGKIEVSVKTEGQTALNKSVTVTTNDPSQPQITLNLTANVVPEFVLSERNIYFGSVPPGKEAVKEILVTIAPDRAVKLISAESTDANFAVRLEPVAGSNGKSVKLIAVQKADAKPGYHFGTVKVKTTSALRPELNISARGMVAAGAAK